MSRSTPLTGAAAGAERSVRESGVRVTLAAMRFPPDYAGPALRFQRYGPRLEARGIEIDVCAMGLRPGVHGTRTLAGTPVVEEEVSGIAVQRLQIEATTAVRSIHHRYARALAAHVDRMRPGVVQLLQMSPWGLAGLWAIRRQGVPIVYTETMMPDAALARPLRGAHWRLPFKLLSGLVVSSSAMRDAMQDCGIRMPIEVIPNGVDLARFRPVDADERGTIREKLGLPLDAPIVLFVGGYLSRRKGLDVLAEAWPLVEERHADARLVLVGPDDVSSYRATGPQRAFLEGIRDRLARAMGEQRVTLTGSVDHVEEYFQAADVFVFPSRKEGMPNVVPEACACGVPIVLTAFQGLSAELGRPGETFELVDRHPHAIAKQISSLLADPSRRETLGRSARAWVENHMDVERSVDAYADLYRRLADSSAAPRRREAH